MFGTNSSTDTVRCPHLPPQCVANALMGFQLRTACGREYSLLFERVPLPKARTWIFLSSRRQMHMNIVIRTIYFATFVGLLLVCFSPSTLPHG